MQHVACNNVVAFCISEMLRAFNCVDVLCASFDSCVTVSPFPLTFPSNIELGTAAAS